MMNKKSDSVWADIKEHILLVGGMKLSVILLCVIMFLAMAIQVICVPEKRWETSDTADYGKFVGTRNDQVIDAYIRSFFPEELQNTFSDVSYSFRASNIGRYACEAYLEFTIEDPEEFHEYVAKIADASCWKEFTYDESFLEYTLDDTLYLSLRDTPDAEKEQYHYITEATIRKVLCSISEQKIIYTAILVSNDSVIETSYFNALFMRFGIDPVEYWQAASKT